MDGQAANQNPRLRPVLKGQRRPTASTNKLSQTPNISTRPLPQASSRNIMLSNFRGNMDSHTMLARLGLDVAQNYIELKTGDCFIQLIDDLLYCALCFKKFSTFRNNPKNSQSPHVSTGDSSQRNAHFSRPPNSDNNRQDSRDEHIDHKHQEAFRLLISRLNFSTPGLQSMNMMTLKYLTARWLDENLLKDQMKLRMTAINDFSAILNQVDPQCKLRAIGSTATGVMLLNSNVNLEVIHPNNKLFEKDPRSKSSIHHKLVNPHSEYGEQINNHTIHYDLIGNASDTLYRIAKLIEHNSSTLPEESIVTLVRKDFCSELSSKTPKLTLIHEPSRIKLEIMCHAGTRYRLDCLVKNYMILDKRVLQLGIIVEQWAEICRISDVDNGTLSPETWMVLVIYFLQRIQPPVLPCLHEMLIKSENQSRGRDHGTSGFIDKTRKHSESAVEDSDNVDGSDNEIEDGPEDGPEDETIGHFDLDEVVRLNWTSQNTDPIHKLFINFLEFNLDEFSQTKTVISIRTRKKVTIFDKKWRTHLKSIENPISPCNNLAKSISSPRTFEYIRECLAYGYLYLTSIPVTDELKPRVKPLTHHDLYARQFFNLPRYLFYLNMRKEIFDNDKKINLMDDMIQQKLFTRDVVVVQKLVEYSKNCGIDIEELAQRVAKHYDQSFLRPPDGAPTTSCCLCQRPGHVKLDCPNRRRRSVKLLGLDGYKDSVEFDDELIKLFEDDRITPEQSIRHSDIVNRLERIICSGTGLDCELRLFGSTVNLLGSIDSDMDICMTLRDKPNVRDVDCIKVLKKTTVALSRNKLISDIEPILAAKVPIIKFKYDDYAVDLSMYNECAIYNSGLLRTYVTIDIRVAQLCYLVKRYARACGIADASRGSLSSYAWSLMVIHFLQHTSPPILPVLQATTGRKPFFGVDGWNVWFEENTCVYSLKPNKSSLTSLFKEFLHYYSKFDFDQYVVSIRTEKILTKFQKNWTSSMIAVEDPFVLTFNLAGGVQEQMALYILESFPRAYEFIHDFQMTFRRLSKRPKPEELKRLFNGREIMGKNPPLQGCRHCGRIGHRVKDCPEKVPKKSKRR